MSDAVAPRYPWMRGVHGSVRWSAGIGVMALYLPTLLGLLARRSLVAEITTHFVGLYFMFAAIGLIACVAYRAWMFSGLAALLVIVHGAAVLPWYVSDSSRPNADDANLRILNANLLTSNSRYGEILELASKERPDVIFIQEMDRAWEIGLRALEEAYPYNVRIPRPDNFGMALYSRLPLIDARHIAIADTGIPEIRADILLNGRKITLYNVHLMPPSSRLKFDLRNDHLAAMGGFVRTQDDLVVVAGDLNTAMWSPYYRAMVQDTGLVNARKGFGVVPTWPAFYPMLKIPIDHCLVTPEIGVAQLRRGPRIGSDHLPIIVDLRVPSPAQETD